MLSDVLPTLLVSGRSRTIGGLFVRYLTTIKYLISWYSSDPFDSNSEAFKTLKIVRKMHSEIAEIMNFTNKRESGELHVSQFEMALTQWTFVGLVNMHPQVFGFHSKKESELKAANYV